MKEKRKSFPIMAQKQTVIFSTIANYDTVGADVNVSKY